ncbi:hypothetical protein GI374_02880 [Paracoccus sp. S-4012]|uniref:Mth938-like domain-containing protein n=1 Tax=Paracoccus sp. S-4012 TaxID=2665648 RepID=UPI0012AFFF5B|nr:Mth938-like domain-containing protein [Paracoccus sp. S-4012]MRX49406.1 hypothetical protein [Paracoccus sp. S-4012]
MAMTPAEYDGAVPIDGYGPGFVRLGGKVHRGAVVIHDGRATPWGGLEDEAPLIALAAVAELLVIGLGAEVARLPEGLLDALEAVGLRVEVMSTPAAARVYNLLLSEGRQVAAALLPT